MTGFSLLHAQRTRSDSLSRTFRVQATPTARQTTMKRTYQASKTRRARTHGFLVRMKTRGGRAVINARRAKGRKRLAV
jgi:large subunit ribosomal protein L34